MVFSLDLLKIHLAATCDSLCNSDNTQLHLLLSSHVGSKSGITTPLILLQVETNLILSLCIKHSHPLTILMALHSTRSSMSTPPLYKGVQMWTCKGEDTSLGLPVTFFAHTTHYTATLLSTLCTFHRSLTYLTGFPLIHVRWCNLAAFGLKKQAGGSIT